MAVTTEGLNPNHEKDCDMLLAVLLLLGPRPPLSPKRVIAVPSVIISTQSGIISMTHAGNPRSYSTSELTDVVDGSLSLAEFKEGDDREWLLGTDWTFGARWNFLRHEPFSHLQASSTSTRLPRSSPPPPSMAPLLAHVGINRLLATISAVAMASSMSLTMSHVSRVPHRVVPLIALALSTVPVASATSSGVVDDMSLPSDFRYSYTDHATRLHSDLLDGYNMVVPPKSKRRPAQDYGTQAGTDVSVEMRVFKVESLNPAEGAMRLKVWLQMSWHDDRLTWDGAEYGNLTKVWFNAPAGDDAPEIWVPDIKVYNSREAIMSTLDQAHAVVQPDGRVYWSRPGMLDVMCKFQGLVAFPFDTLKCGIDMGGWIIGGGHQGISVQGDGVTFSAQEATAGSSYQEYSIKYANSTVQLFTYECCPSDPYPVVSIGAPSATRTRAAAVLAALPRTLQTQGCLPLEHVREGLTRRAAPLATSISLSGRRRACSPASSCE